jgi:hypothetical protein
VGSFRENAPVAQTFDTEYMSPLICECDVLVANATQSVPKKFETICMISPA